MNPASNSSRSLAPLALQTQGSFSVGGTVLTHPGVYHPLSGKPDGQTLHGDHAHVSYQVPVNARSLPLVFLHGHLQFSKTWETTPDGREGFNNLFLRRGWPVYLIDHPRRGRAGRSTLPISQEALCDDQRWFATFRVGIWPDYFEGVRFPRDAASLNQYFRQCTPDTGPYDVQVVSDAVARLFERIGAGVLVTHSQGGGGGWFAALKNPQVRAIASYEPGSNFPFPAGEVPDSMPSSAGPLPAAGVPEPEFLKLTRIPIVIYYGDYIPAEPSPNPGQDQWRVRLDMARLWAKAVNARGGDVQVVHLPKLGITGNTHFPFSDTNNQAIAELLQAWLERKGLA